jgi:hypothetical protein
MEAIICEKCLKMLGYRSDCCMTIGQHLWRIECGQKEVKI